MARLYDHNTQSCSFVEREIERLGLGSDPTPATCPPQPSRLVCTHTLNVMRTKSPPGPSLSPAPNFLQPQTRHRAVSFPEAEPILSQALWFVMFVIVVHDTRW
ncbi:hypothetical protein HBH56_228060 [Parastagonospora nodorum]|uniref:Uncharacterized protein n=1 Tax=Phaeosphaeria nodorum (strain SN15 / ATCC MYA-4574 / FGSC 10173) TaxID=321614 RepID=A0A7U2I0Z7_PHANO|nr:hypothetical protein HBH56_228060 [Parastagonospora nodorum]QRC95791.1 hypothetical protein JI435_432720 [Parastagonospora nodorum SN15]KAH3921666.1 hypothetical protein HBH54_234700 [Parastagonospora nodorum]KAH4124391.1 hypothetical protein HBH45_240200 [Parastagonospora nodorum]KAH4147099.1 hypothetical protein HBH44_231990 [Parastagonospora nodorum]